jgi:hypothetical protein
VPTEPPAPAPTEPPAPAPTEPPAGDIEYVVQEGDTWNGIAEAFGVDAATIAAYNGLPVDYVLQPGDVLVIPQQASQPIIGHVKDRPLRIAFLVGWLFADFRAWRTPGRRTGRRRLRRRLAIHANAIQR